MLSSNDIQASKAWPDATFSSHQASPRTQMSPIAKHLKIGAVNVGTMGYRFTSDEASLGLKAQELMHQFQQASYDVICLTETRARHTMLAQQGQFCRLISASNQGQGGIEIWINQESVKQKLGHQVDVQADITVWHQSHDILAATMNLSGFGVTIVACYAPQSGRPDEHIQQWWQNFCKIIRSNPTNTPMCIAGDFNGRVGSVVTDGIGDHNPDMEDVAGECIRAWCQECDLIIPSTFSAFHDGQSHTFVNPRGASSRIDYIAVSQTHVEAVQTTFVDDDIDVMNGDRDHKMIALILCLAPHRQRATGIVRQDFYDRQLARTQNETTTMLHQVQPKCWEQEVNEHWSEFRDEVQTMCAKTFPKTKRKQRQAYFCEDTWQILCDRKEIRAQHRQQQRVMNLTILAKCFAAWKRPEHDKVQALDHELHCQRLMEAVTYNTRVQIDSNFKKHKIQAWKNWVEKHADKQADQANHAVGAALFHALQPKRAIAKHTGKARRPLPGFKTTEGQWVCTKADIAEAWDNQFASIERAEKTHMHCLIAKAQPINHQWPSEVLMQIPSLYDLETAIRGLNPTKAAGLDGIGGEIFKANPTIAAKRTFPMLMKCSLRQQWIAEFSGGWLIPLHKGKMLHHLMEGHRAILLEPCLARAFSKTWRARLEPGLADYAPPGQWGGRKGAGIESVHAVLRMTQSTARALHQSLGIVFIDIRSAFYSIAKPLLSSKGVTEADIQQLMRIMNIPDHVTEQFKGNLQDTDVVKQVTRSQLAAGMVRATMASTWFCVPGTNHIRAPATGTRPGDPLADTLYAMVMSVVLQKINHRLEEEAVFCQNPQPDIMLPQNVTWVDDAAFMIQCPADQLCQKTTTVMRTILEVMSEHGLSLSYGPGKTAIMLQFQGKKAQKCKQECEAQWKGKCVVFNEYTGAVTVPLVTHYKHLGGFLERSGSTHAEIRVRAAQTMVKAKALNKISRNPKIELSKRRTVLKAITLPIISLHAGSWIDLGIREYEAWKGALFKLYGMLAPPSQDPPHTTMYQRAHEFQSCMPLEVIYVQRLRLLKQMLKAGDQFVFSTVVYNHRTAKESSWLAGAVHAVAWMYSQIGDRVPQFPIESLKDVDAWMHLGHWAQVTVLTKQIRAAIHSHMFRIRTHVEVQQSDANQRKVLHSMGWGRKGFSDTHDEDQTHACHQCDKVFMTQAALAVHEQRKHGLRMAVRRFVKTPACPICHKWFHTRTRALTHMHWSGTSCWFLAMRHYEPMSVEEAADLDAQDRSNGDALHQKAFRSYQKDQTWRWCSDQEIESSKLANKMPEWDANAPLDQELTAWSHWGSLPPGQGGRCKTTRVRDDVNVFNATEDIQILEKKWSQEVPEWIPNDSFIPEPMSDGRKFILLFFSGRRREGDMGHWISQKSDLIPIAIDTAVHEVHGNLFREAFWVNLIRAKKVAGGHAGPPCETFSLARWLEVANMDQQPRPLRDAQYPWGMPNRSLRETCQAMTGSILYVRVIHLLLLIYSYGGAFTLEHPREPSAEKQKQQWTIWQSAFVKRALQSRDIFQFCFLQGPLGRRFAKPTMILCGRLKGLPKALYEHYNPMWRATDALGGRNAHGKGWKTSQAKEYPPLMNLIFAEEFLQFAANLECGGWHDDPEGTEEMVQHLGRWDPYEGVQEMKGDFQPEWIL